MSYEIEVPRAHFDVHKVPILFDETAQKAEQVSTKTNIQRGEREEGKTGRVCGCGSGETGRRLRG